MCGRGARRTTASSGSSDFPERPSSATRTPKQRSENMNTMTANNDQPKPESLAGPGCAVASGSPPRCRFCKHPAHHVRVRNFDTEDADVWMCGNPLCVGFDRVWHTPRPKSEAGELRCALIELVEAEKSSRDNFDSDSIGRIERALLRADRALFPERYTANVKDQPRP